MKLQSLAVSALVALPLAASALPLAGLGYATYGNVNSYSMPLSAIQYASMFGGGVGPGNPYYIPSGPGQIQDQVVIYTGANGQEVNTNAAGFDNAYGAPNGGTDGFASISGSVNMINPGNKAGITNNLANTWDANLLALKGFLDGGNPLFLFNNNDTNADQNLAIWAKIWITDGNNSNSVYNNRWLYLSNEGRVYGAAPNLLGDATLYNPGDVTDPPVGYASTDYVLSGGTVNGVNHNLGANQVAYAGDVPLLNQWLGTLFGLQDAILNNFTMHLDLKLGCTSTADWPRTGLDKQGNLTDLACKDVAIDNGFEQLFLVSSKFDPPEVVPEPGSIALVGMALAGLALTRRRRTYTSSQVA